MTKKLEENSDIELYYLLGSEKKTSDRAFTELYNRLSPRVYAYCRRFLGNKEEAQDVFQEVFVRFFNSSNQKREMTNVPAFILRIARNLCVNAKRNERVNITYEDYMYIHDNDRDEKDELLNLIKKAIDLLPEDYREIFILREYDGMTYNDIAEITGESLSNVKVRIYRAKQKIREILQPYMEEMEKFN